MYWQELNNVSCVVELELIFKELGQNFVPTATCKLGQIPKWEIPKIPKCVTLGQVCENEVWCGRTQWKWKERDE